MRFGWVGLRSPNCRKGRLPPLAQGDSLSWDELLRLIASIRMGKIGADLALRFLGSAAQGDPAYRAAEHLGRLLRSIFLCGYVTIEDLHREIHTLLAGARRFINCRGLSTQANCAPSADGGAMR